MKLYLTVFLALSLATASAARAVVIAVDLDPGTPAVVDDSLSVAPGTPFSVSVVVFDDAAAPAAFDTILLEVFFNDAGATLSLAGPGPLGGALAGNSFLTLDLFGLAPSAEGAPLTAGPGSPALPAGFAGQSGAVGLVDPLGFLAGAVPRTVFSLDFVALAPGTSTLSPRGTPLGNSAASLFGVALPKILRTGTVTVTGPGVGAPEPGTGVLLIAGAVLGAVFSRAARGRRRGRAQRPVPDRRLAVRALPVRVECRPADRRHAGRAAVNADLGGARGVYRPRISTAALG